MRIRGACASTPEGRLVSLRLHEPGSDCTCEDYDPTCRHDEYPEASVCPGCGARRDCPEHGVSDEDAYYDSIRHLEDA